MATTSSSKPKIVVLGDMAVGKTSILKQFISQKFSTHHKATLGADFMEKMVQLPDRVVALQLWDTCGQERFDSLGLAYYRGSDGCILVYDVTNPKSLENLKNWKAKFLEIVGAASKPVFICLGNKSDLEHAVTPAEAQAAAKDLGCHHEFVCHCLLPCFASTSPILMPGICSLRFDLCLVCCAPTG